MRVELAKNVIDFNEGLNSKIRMREIISEIHNVCISDIHFQNDQLSGITEELDKSSMAIKSKKIVLEDVIDAVEKLKKNNKALMFNIDEHCERLLNDLTGN